MFWQTGNFDFIELDDPRYVVDNPEVNTGLSLHGLGWAFTTTHAANWHPLTWLSHMLDCQLYRLSPGGHHLTNLAVHTANSVLLFIALRSMLYTAAAIAGPTNAAALDTQTITGPCWFVAAIFAAHPLRVESVAWVAERKDLLAGLFWMLSLWAYSWYARNPSIGRYALVALGLMLGLLSKPSAVTLPAVLLLADYWPLGRWPRPEVGLGIARGVGRLIVEKLPLAALSVAASLTTLIAQQRGGAVTMLEFLPLHSRLENALVTYVTYLVQYFWPAHLSVFYPHPYVVGVRPSPWLAIGSAAVLLCITIICVAQSKRRPYLLTGWLWYLIVPLPMIGLVQVGVQAHADRYTYLSLIGISIMIAWGIPSLLATLFANRAHRQTTLSVAGTVWVCLYAIAAWRYTGDWRSTETLFQHAARVVPNNYLAHQVLGKLRLRQNDLAGAEAEFGIANKIYVNDTSRELLSDLFLRSSTAHLARNELPEAATCLRRALELRPDSPEIANNVAWMLATHPEIKQRTPDEAIALALGVCRQTGFKRYEYLDTLAVAYAAAGRFTEAEQTAQRAYRLAVEASQGEVARQIAARCKLFAKRQAYSED